MNIILAVDGSEHAQAALELLLCLPLPAQTSVMALAVADSPKTPRHYVLLEVLEQAEKALSKTQWPIAKGLLHGHPAQEIVRFSDEVKPSLILMGAKGLRATLGILLGGVAQQVIEHANWPVLVTRPPFQGLKKILIVLDGSPCSQNALEYLLHFPFPPKAEYTLLNVLPPQATEEEIMTATWAAGVDAVSIRPTIKEELQKSQEQEEQLSEALLLQALNKCKERYPKVATVLRRGDAATEILAYAKDASVDLIIAGSRGLSAIGGWLLGSVSRKIVHYATCSVLIVKGEHCST